MTKFSELTARDAMRTELVTLSPDDSIEDALALFEESRIGGAPVVDGSGKLVGVLTLSDVARTEHVSGNRIETQRGTFDMGELSGEERTDELDPDEIYYVKEDYSAAVLGAERVSDWMTHEVIAVAPEAPLTKVCAAMVDKQIHRVFVTERHRLVGVVSSFDVVRCVARAGGAKKRATS